MDDQTHRIDDDDLTAGLAPHQGPIPPHDERVRYAEASWTDAYHVAVRAIRADYPHAGKHETIAASEADWRWRLISEGDHARGIFPLEISPPDLETFKLEVIDEMALYAERANHETPIWLYGRFRFPATEEFHGELCQLIANQITRFRALRQCYEAQLQTLDGQTVTLPDKPGAGYGKDKDEPVSYLADVLDARRKMIKRLVHDYAIYVQAAKSNDEVAGLIGELQAKVDQAVAP